MSRNISIYNNIKLLIIVPGYEKVITHSKITCHVQKHQITVIEDTDVTTCRKKCDNQPSCKYFFFNEDETCRTFSSCSEQRTCGVFGVTYQKAQGK